MQNFGYSVAEQLEQAFATDGVNTMLIAGGTELLNWFRLGIAAPDEVVDIGRLKGLNRIEASGDHLSIGALATLGEVGEHPLVKEHATVLSEACLAAASPQIRNRATIGGNVLQKTRCTYFRAEEPLPWACNKREPGSGCAALGGLNDRHAIFGWTDACVATQPSDPVVALAALNAEAELASSSGKRRLSIAELFLTPAEAGAEISAGRIRDRAENAARIETRLRPGEVITGYHLPIRSGERSAYVKVRERASYEYALVSAAAVLGIEGGRITRASIALGSVAQKPWRLAAAEARLVGQPPERDAVLPILQESLAEARPLSHNRYKMAMSAGAAARAIVNAGGMA